MKKPYTIPVIILLAVAVALGFYLLSPSDSIDTSNWETYTNEEYGFSLKHPSDWQVAEYPDDPIAVKFNVYKPANSNTQPPFIHHSYEATHVSIFPQGVPTEGVSGEQVATEVDFGVPIIRAHDYILSDGTRFATYASIDSPLESWTESGFAFAHVRVENLGVECRRNGESISDEQCDVLTGDTLVRQGSVDEEDRAIQVAILESLRLTEEGDGGEVTQYKDLIRLFEPVRNGTVSSPLTITGEARGNWYFEASFPVRIEDANGNVLGQHFATAQGEWMTSEYVPFEADLSFSPPGTETGTLVLEKDNPSGLPENDDQLRVPIRFSSAGPQRTIQLYYYNSSLDEDANGNIMCSDQGLVAVDRTIPVTQTPIQDTIRLLLQGEISSAEAAQGITTEYPLAGFKLQGASLAGDTLTLSFSDPNSATSGGSCRAGILWFQIRETAKQFDGVENVNFQPEELFQP